MAKSSYLPQEDALFNTWLINLNIKLPVHAATLGITAPQLAGLNADTLNFSYWLTQSNLFKDEKEERTAYKDLQRNGPIGFVGGPSPTPPVIPAAPAVVLPGIEPRVRILVQYIKNHPNYTAVIGQDLDVIGSEIVVDLPNLKPILTLVKLGIGIDVQWKKGPADALRIEKSVVVSPGPPPIWTFLAIDTEPNYMDTSPMGVSQLWQYRAIYIINDGMVGQWSDVTSIAIG